MNCDTNFSKSMPGSSSLELVKINFPLGAHASHTETVSLNFASHKRSSGVLTPQSPLWTRESPEETRGETRGGTHIEVFN